MQKINFENLPSTTTPVNATNLNQVQTNVENAINTTLIYKDLPANLTTYKNITSPGIYTASSSIECPYTGTLVVLLRGSTNYRHYIFIRYDSLIWISTYWNGTWYEWTQL